MLLPHRGAKTKEVSTTTTTTAKQTFLFGPGCDFIPIHNSNSNSNSNKQHKIRLMPLWDGFPKGLRVASICSSQKASLALSMTLSKLDYAGTP